MSALKAPTFEVRCPDYIQVCSTREIAERWKASVEEFGVCRHPHEIVEVS